MITANSIEHLIPDFLMESDHFYLVVMNVEGRVMDANFAFEKSNGEKSGKDFFEQIDEASAAELEVTIDELLNSPKEKKHMILNHSGSGDLEATPIWWEFSVVTDSEMDILGLIGAGVEINFLSQEMPWANLVDVLQFGRIRLSAEFLVEDWDEKVTGWIGSSSEEYSGSSISELEHFDFSQELDKARDIVKGAGKPAPFILPSRDSAKHYFALLSATSFGYQLFVLPRMPQVVEKEMARKFDQNYFDVFSGAVWMIDRDQVVIGLNNEAVKVGRLWAGKGFGEGSKFSFKGNRHLAGVSKQCVEALDGKTFFQEIQLEENGRLLGSWSLKISPVMDKNGEGEAVLIHAMDITDYKRNLAELESQNSRLRELAIKPSHILRSPLSSMLGLLDLINFRQLDSENQKYFSYLKPLAKKMDEVIRANARKMSTFD